MTTQQDIHAMRLFAQLADLPAAEQTEKLDELCAGDAQLRALVAAMLAADARDEEPFAGHGAQWHEALSGEQTEQADAMTGRRIGAWEITGVIGRGGMGTVYAARRNDGAYEQQAALKLIRSAADSPAARERFLRERQVLAQLHHPGIATLLDGGFTSDGDPYFVMEYIHGTPIDQYCDAHMLGLRERIQLFLRVLDAVACAHRSLVVHRDLKPSNVLVDEEGHVKLLDFGIAKQLEGEDTATSDRALTFEYASPEQLHAAPITTATDIWQLGIVLHRLLSGAHPFGLSRDTPLPRQLQLLEREPEPLTRAAAHASSNVAAQRGGLTPATLARELRGALSNVVQGCLRREPGQRYSSVDALGDDLQRWLQHRPLRIAPVSRWVRTKLWLRRNRIAAAAAAAVILALVAGAGVALWQAREARAQAQIAEQQNANARDSMRILIESLASTDPDNGSSNLSAHQLLDNARIALNQHDELAPRMRQELQSALGILYKAQGSTNTAAELLETGTKDMEPENREDALGMADALGNLAGALGELGRGQESLAAAQHAVALRSRFAPNDPVQRLKSMSDLGSAYYYSGDFSNARQQWQDAIALAKTMPAPPMNFALNSYQLLGGVLAFEGEYPHALQVLDEGLSFADAHNVPPYSLSRVYLLLNKSSALLNNGNAAAAEQTIRQAIAVQEKIFGPDGGGTLTANLYNTLGGVLDGLGRFRESVAAHERSLALSTESADSPLTSAITLGNIGSSYEEEGEYAKSMETFNLSMARLDQAGIDAEDMTRRQLERMYARGLGAAGRFADADRRLRSLQEKSRRLDGEDSDEYAFILFQRVTLARRMRDAKNGEPLLAEVRQRYAKRLPETNPVFAHALRAEATFAQVRGDLPAAEHAQREALQRLQTMTSPFDIAIAQAELAAIRTTQGDKTEARTLLQQALPVLRQSVLPQEINRAAAEKLAKQLGV